MEHLTQRCSWFELSDTLMTLPEACHGCQQHSKHTHSVCASGKSFKFHYRKKMFIWQLYKTLDVCHLHGLTRFDKFYSLAPQTHHTSKNMFFPPEVTENQNHLILMWDCVHNMLLKWYWPQKRKKCLAQPKALCHTATHICNALYDSTMQH